MTDDRLPLAELAAKSGDADFLRAIAESVLQLIMEADIDGLIGAGRYERGDGRQTWRNGYRDRPLDTRLGTLNLKIPKMRSGTYFPGFLEPRKSVEKALVAVIQEAWINGVSTRKVDELVQAMGMTGISRSSVSKLCRDIDERGDIIGDFVLNMERAPLVRLVTERRKVKGAYHPVGAEDLGHLGEGRSVLFISPDPEGVLDEAVLASADAMITIPELTPARLRQVIRRVTGGVARGVTEAMTRLKVGLITTLVRRELTAGECVENLDRAVGRKPARAASSVPILNELPMTDAIRKWTDQTWADLEAVKRGTMQPDQLVFGMLEGPPGTGKSLIAESLARTADWTFVPTSVGAWFTTGDGALGGVARNLKSFIDQVLSSEPAIGFMDELDALPNRATMDNRGRDWWTPIINLFLTEIDRLRKSNRKVLLLGATNYYAHLDSALIRPGRLQQRVSVLPPQTESEVIALMRYYLKDDLAEVDLGRLGRVGCGVTPAMVEGWLKEARGTARRDKRPLELSDILGQIVPEDNRTPADIRAIAIHEMGHAVVAHRLGQMVESVSIIADGNSGGRTWTRLTTIVPTWDHLLDMATVTLGGRAADIVLGDGPNAGAEGDLASATEVVMAAHERQGLRGSLVFAPSLGTRHADTVVAVNAVLRRLLKRAMAIVEADRDLLLQLAGRLITERVLSGDEVATTLGTTYSNVVPRKPARTRRSMALPSGSKPRFCDDH